VPDVVGRCTGNANASRFGQLLQARSHIDGITVPIIVFNDHIADMHAHAHVDALMVGKAVVACRHLALQQDSALYRIDDAAEFHQETVAHQLEDAAVVLLDFRLEHFFAVRPQPLKGSYLVCLHQSAVANYVGGQDSSKAALHVLLGHISGRSRGLRRHQL
jgi:hypothetical protein